MIRPTFKEALFVAAVCLVAIWWPTIADAATTATARHTDDPTVVVLTVRIDITVKRPLERKVFAEPCGLDVICDAREVSKRVQLHKGRNRRTVTLTVRRMVYEFVGVQVTGTPWNGYQMVPVPANVLWVRFGQYGRAREVRPSPVAHDTLKDVTP